MLLEVVRAPCSCGDALPARETGGLPLELPSGSEPEPWPWPVGELSSGDVPSIGWSTGLGGDMLMVGGGAETEMETGTIREPVES